MSVTLPAFLKYTTEKPPASAYNLVGEVDVTLCLARRQSNDHRDRRWTPFVYVNLQCKNKPVSGSDLCDTCLRHESKGSAWHGRITEEPPAKSYFGGSLWFHTKAVWNGTEKPKTRRQEERADRRRLISDLEIRRFLSGAVTLNIEMLSQDNQIESKQLRDMACILTKKAVGSKRINGYSTKGELCKLIRTLMDPESPIKPVFTVQYPKSDEGSVSSVEDDAGTDALAAENAELRAEIAALRAKLEAAAAILSSVS